MAKIATTNLVLDDLSESVGSRVSATSILARLVRQLEKRHSRKALLDMSDEQLKDLALSRADAYREGHRRIWD